MESRLIFRCINQWRTPLLAGIAFLIPAAGLIATGAATTPAPLTVALFVAQLGGGIVVPTMLTWAVRGVPFEPMFHGMRVAFSPVVCRRL